MKPRRSHNFSSAELESRRNEGHECLVGISLDERSFPSELIQRYINREWELRGIAWLPGINIWLQIWDLPFEYQQSLVAKRMALLPRGVLQLDWEERQPRNIRFMRIRVSVDLTFPLVPGCTLERDDGTSQWIRFRYEMVHKFCLNCGEIGHTQRNCHNSFVEVERRISLDLNRTSQRHGFPIVIERDTTHFSNQMRAYLTRARRKNTRIGYRQVNINQITEQQRRRVEYNYLENQENLQESSPPATQEREQLLMAERQQPTNEDENHKSNPQDSTSQDRVAMGAEVLLSMTREMAYALPSQNRMKLMNSTKTWIEGLQPFKISLTISCNVIRISQGLYWMSFKEISSILKAPLRILATNLDGLMSLEEALSKLMRCWCQKKDIEQKVAQREKEGQLKLNNKEKKMENQGAELGEGSKSPAYKCSVNEEDLVSAFLKDSPSKDEKNQEPQKALEERKGKRVKDEKKQVTLILKMDEE
ncbi:Zinc knuckle CX2CX4HX4C [Corchorus olitorius]|uniref:Zinc knuckle CX2CX4HX4C n=1 Tax=Corchorus olitorius TaxID=93759 RepID=A0A1R3IMW2_9ROSI|nr:Zinc knuckle CX2CX4HX4C [Corchorus olitorius]